jgi:hypothetical protein
LNFAVTVTGKPLFDELDVDPKAVDFSLAVEGAFVSKVVESAAPFARTLIPEN